MAGGRGGGHVAGVGINSRVWGACGRGLEHVAWCGLMWPGVGAYGRGMTRPMGIWQGEGLQVKIALD